MAKWKVKVHQTAYYIVEVEAESSDAARRAALDQVKIGEAKAENADLWTSLVKKIKD